MMTLSMNGFGASRLKTPDCYHLVTVKSAARLQLFAAAGIAVFARTAISKMWMRAVLVLDLFSRGVMF
jgi:hypothetical protein